MTNKLCWWSCKHAFKHFSPPHKFPHHHPHLSCTVVSIALWLFEFSGFLQKESFLLWETLFTLHELRREFLSSRPVPISPTYTSTPHPTQPLRSSRRDKYHLPSESVSIMVTSAFTVISCSVTPSSPSSFSFAFSIPSSSSSSLRSFSLFHFCSVLQPFPVILPPSMPRTAWTQLSQQQQRTIQTNNDRLPLLTCCYLPSKSVLIMLTLFLWLCQLHSQVRYFCIMSSVFLWFKQKATCCWLCWQPAVSWQRALKCPLLPSLHSWKRLKKKLLNFFTLDDLMVDMDVFGIQKALRKARSPAGPDLPSCVLPSLTEPCQINQKHF